MTLTVERTGQRHEVTGRPLTHYRSDGPVVYTGPIAGGFALADGTVYDATPDFVEVASAEHAVELSHLIGLQHELDGHPSHAPTDRDPYPEPFRHLCTPRDCGPHVRPVSDPMQAAALARAERNWQGATENHPHEGHRFGQALGFVDPAAPPPEVMALASAAAENAALNGLDGTGSTNVIPDTSLHTATTSTTGAAETANSGSYARQACSYNAGAGGSKTNSTSLTFSTLGTIPITHVGTWSSAVYGAGTFAIGGALTASVTSASITIASGALTLSAT